MPHFIKSAVTVDGWIKDQVSEICIVGRSNAGKSSLINVLANQQIAKTSKTPGRTQTINFYDFHTYRLVDLPGYGFMKGNHDLKNQVSNIINEYLSQRINLYGVLQICDANVITEADVAMSKFLQKRFKNHFIILNKIDKSSLSVYQNKAKTISKYLNITPDKMIFASMKKRLYIDKINHVIHSILGQLKK
jgi:GTP-binding protein